MATAIKKTKAQIAEEQEEERKAAAQRELRLFRQVNDELSKQHKELRRSPNHPMYEELGQYYVATLPANLGYFDSVESAAEQLGVDLD